jgi:hypothetical protein
VGGISADNLYNSDEETETVLGVEHGESMHDTTKMEKVLPVVP